MEEYNIRIRGTVSRYLREVEDLPEEDRPDPETIADIENEFLINKPDWRKLTIYRTVNAIVENIEKEHRKNKQKASMSGKLTIIGKRKRRTYIEIIKERENSRDLRMRYGFDDEVKNGSEKKQQAFLKFRYQRLKELNADEDLCTFENEKKFLKLISKYDRDFDDKQGEFVSSSEEEGNQDGSNGEATDGEIVDSIDKHEVGVLGDSYSQEVIANVREEIRAAEEGEDESIIEENIRDELPRTDETDQSNRNKSDTIDKKIEHPLNIRSLSEDFFTYEFRMDKNILQRVEDLLKNVKLDNALFPIYESPDLTFVHTVRDLLKGGYNNRISVIFGFMLAEFSANARTLQKIQCESNFKLSYVECKVFRRIAIRLIEIKRRLVDPVIGNDVCIFILKTYYKVKAEEEVRCGLFLHEFGRRIGDITIPYSRVFEESMFRYTEKLVDDYLRGEVHRINFRNNIREVFENGELINVKMDKIERLFKVEKQALTYFLTKDMENRIEILVAINVLELNDELGNQAAMLYLKKCLKKYDRT